MEEALPERLEREVRRALAAALEPDSLHDECPTVGKMVVVQVEMSAENLSQGGAIAKVLRTAIARVGGRAAQALTILSGDGDGEGLSWERRQSKASLFMRQRAERGSGIRQVELAPKQAASQVSRHVKILVTKVREMEEQAVSTKRIGHTFDPHAVDCFPLVTWNRSRILDRGLHQIREGARPIQTWLPEAAWQRLVTEHRNRAAGGSTCFLVDYSLDHGEGGESDALILTVAPSEYSEFMATHECIESSPDVLANLRMALGREDPRKVARSAPPSVMAVFVTVMNIDRTKFLAVKRSSAVHHEQHLWLPGAAETMKWRGERPEAHDATLFQAVERGLRGELGLEPQDYGAPLFSWLGYVLPYMAVMAIAHVHTALAEDEVIRRARESAEAYEAEDQAWIALNSASVSAVCEAPQQALNHEWAPRSAVILSELLRVQQYVPGNESAH